ncbi:MAG TPA: hypothetical protein VF145_11565, partial [Chitinophagaceae bacterium]
MDQYKRETGAYLTAVILFGCAFIFLCLGTGMIFSYPDKIWQVGVLLLGCAAAMVYGGISNLRLGKKISRDATVQLLVGNREQTDSETESGADEREQETPYANGGLRVLAHWRLPVKDSRYFVQQEKSRRKTSTTIESMVLAVMGTFALMLLKGESFVFSVLLSILLAGVYWVGKYYLSINSLGHQREMEVVVTD